MTKRLLLGGWICALYLCGCGRQTPAPPAPPSFPQIALRPAPPTDPIDATSSLASNEIIWAIKIASVPIHKIEELGLKPLYSATGDRNALVDDLLARSRTHQLAREITNILIKNHAGGYGAVCSRAVATNLAARLEMSTGVDVLTPKPIKSTGAQPADFSITDNLNIILKPGNEGHAPVMTNAAVGLDISLRAQTLATNQLRLEVGLRTEGFTGYSRGDRDGDPTFAVAALGARTDLRSDEALLIGGPLQWNVQQSIDRVAIFSNIPVLGPLFTTRRTNTNYVRTVMVIWRADQ